MKALLGVVCALISVPAQATPFHVVATSETSEGPLRRVTRVVQNGSEPLNRFGVERVFKAGAVLRGAVVLAPPMSAMGAFYDVGDPDPAALAGSMVARLAMADLDVYVYDPRASFLAAGACETIDCSPAADWGIQARVDDLQYVRRLVRSVHGRRKPVIGGHSLGAIVAFAAVNQDPEAWSGVIAIDGGLLTYDAALSAGYRDLCRIYTKSFKKDGQLFDPANTSQVLKALVGLGVLDPGGPSPFVAGFTNRQAYLFFMTAPSPGPPANLFANGLVFVAGSVAEDRVFFANESRLLGSIGAFADYIPLREMIDYTCGVGGDPTFTVHLRKFHGPALGFAAGRGAGALVPASLDALGGPTELESFPELGHNDLIFHVQHGELLEGRILTWIEDSGVFDD